MSGAGTGSDAVRRRLKIATHRSVKDAGGLDAVAEITRVGRKTIHDYSNTGNPRHALAFMPVDVLADLIADARERGEVPQLLLFLCELAGGSFVPVPEPDRDSTAQQLELTAVNQRLWAFSGLVSRHLGGELDEDDFATEAQPVVRTIGNDFAQLMQLFLTVKGNPHEPR